MFAKKHRGAPRDDGGQRRWQLRKECGIYEHRASRIVSSILFTPKLQEERVREAVWIEYGDTEACHGH